jgi:hypothetical protein
MTLPHPDEKPVTVRTTMQPDTDLEVSASEAEELRAQGLLVEAGPKPAREERETPGTSTQNGAASRSTTH